MSWKKIFTRSPNENFANAIVKINKTLVNRQVKTGKANSWDLKRLDVQYTWDLPEYLEISKNEIEKYEYFADKILNHQFDLLGTGWVSFNSSEKQKTSGAINKEYRSLAWNKDVKTGFQWPKDEWAFNLAAGVQGDVKVPWELGRGQHLPVLAVAYKLKPQAKLADEFHDQILDFLQANPVGKGVQWMCPMDIGIRLCNWVIAWDFFKSAGAKFSSEFEDKLTCALLDGADWIYKYREWTYRARSNHYLANIAGLLFVASRFKTNEITSRWFHLGKKEYFKELYHQFNKEGSNYEGSISYHRLSAELVFYSYLCLKRQGADNIRAERQLLKIRNFTTNVTKPDGRIPQFGDTDSGKLFKFVGQWKWASPSVLKSTFKNLENWNCDDSKVLVDDLLNHSDLVETIGLLAGSRASMGLESQIIRFNTPRIQSNRQQIFKPLTQYGKSERFTAQKMRPRKTNGKAYEFDVNFEQCQRFAYPRFGVFIYKNKQNYLAIRCGRVGQEGIGGHDHLDQLGIELYSQGKLVIADPGTYLYTVNPIARNAYRSVESHFTPRVSAGTNFNLHSGLFYLGRQRESKCLYFGKEGFLGSIKSGSETIYRMITIIGEKIRIEDFTKKGANLVHLTPNSCPYSDSYGWQRCDSKKPVGFDWMESESE